VATAARLIQSARARGSVVGVLETDSMGPGCAATTRGDRFSARSEMMERLLMQLVRVSPRCVEWRVEVREGDPAPVLCLVAQEQEAGLIVAGLGHHDSANERFGAETTLGMLRLARTPVLAVPETFDRPLRRAVVATDFSAGSLNAAREGLALFPSLTDVEFVHVATATDPDLDAIHRWMRPPAADPTWGRGGARRSGDSPIAFRTTALTGRSAQEILQYAGSLGADLIVAGSRGAGLAQRIIVGSTATSTSGDAPCALLAVPAAMKRTWSRLTVPAMGSYRLG
jgi:nucleotide-binding universal stress UspA family protein